MICQLTVDTRHSCFKLLIVLPSWVGDTVMATPFLRGLRMIPRFREARVTLLHKPGLEELLAGSGLADEMLRAEGNMVREARGLGGGRFDEAILLPNSFRSALTVLLARIPKRIGYGRDGRSLLLTRALGAPVPGGFGEPISAVDYYLHLLRMITDDSGQGQTPFDRRIRLTPTGGQVEAANRMLERAGIAGEGERLVLLNPGGNRMDKRWPAERFAALADHIAERSEVRILLNGSPGERALLGSIASMCRAARPVNLAELGGTLGTLLGICARCALVVTNDTGTRHIAAAAGFDHLCRAEEARGRGEAHVSAGRPTRLVTLYGPTDPKWAEIDYPMELELRPGSHNLADLGLEEVARAAMDSLLE